MGRCRRIRWGLVGVGIGLMLFYWTTDAFFDQWFSDGTSFVYGLFHPDPGELLVNLLVYSMLLALMAHAWRKADSLDAALAELATEKARTEAILAAMPDAVTVQDPDYRIVYQNPRMQQDMGAHVGEYCYQAYHGRSEVCPDCRLFADGALSRREICGGEPPRNFEIVAAPLQDAEGRLLAGIETIRDITARRRGEIRLRRQLEAIEASIDGIAMLNSAGEYLYLNQAHAALYGYTTAAELHGKNWQMLYAEEERRRLKTLFDEGFVKSGGWRGEAVGLKKDGSQFPQEISLSALDDGGIICIVRDISDRKQAEDQIRTLNQDLTRQAQDLRLINRDLEAFGYSLAHDLRSPLTGVTLAAQSFSDLCATDLDNAGSLLLDTILRGCGQMEDLIEAMGELFKVSRQEIVRQSVDLSAMGREILTDLGVRHPDRQLDWRVAEGMKASCDPQLVRIVLENLIGNAWKYTSRRELAKIEFGREASAGEGCFFVRDNGAGFEMQEAGKLFQPFQRLHHAADFPGTGIGLATVQRIIDRHAGRIWATGACGQGASFYFTLPN